MEMQLELILGVPLKVIASSYTLNLAADTAVKLIDHQWIPKGHNLCKAIGLDGLTSFLGCFGLCLAFLICACGITAGFHITARLKNQSNGFTKTIFTGFFVFAGCAIAGTSTFFLFIMLVTLGLSGLILIGFLLGAVLLLEYKHQRYNKRVSSARMLVLFSMTFMTMLFAVQSGYNFSNPSVICLLPSFALLGYSVDKIAFKKPRGYIILSFILLVPLTGVVLGVSIDELFIQYPLFIETANIMNAVVYKIMLLTGLIGAIVGALVAYFWMEQELHGLSLWISGPVAVILYNLDLNSQHISLHKILNDLLGHGGELGLIASFAALSGISLGLAVKQAHIMLQGEIVLVILIVIGIISHFLLTSVNLPIMAAIVLCLGLLSTMDTQDRFVPLDEAARDFAILAKVMMGATILGLAGLLTSALGAAGFWGVFVAIGLTTWKAYVVSGEN